MKENSLIICKNICRISHKTRFRSRTNFIDGIIHQNRCRISYKSLKAKICGSLNNNSNDRLVEGKHWSISLAITMERNVEKVISDLRFARSESNVDVPKESKKLTPWRFQTIISLRIESTMRSVTCSAESMGRTKYATIVAVK